MFAVELKNQSQNRKIHTTDLRTYKGRTAEWRRTIRRIAPFEKKFKEIVIRLFRVQERVTLRRFYQMYGRKSELRVSVPIFNPNEWAAEWGEQYENFIISLVYFQARELVDAPDLNHPAVRAAIGERTRIFSQLPNETTAKKIQQVLRDGFSTGKTIPEIAKDIKEVFRDATTRRAQLIARTEVMGAANFGTYLGALDGGFPFKMWITSRDERVRHSHRIDGQVKKIEEPFELADGRKMMYPQDFNERCIIRPLESLPEDLVTGGQPSVEPKELDFSDIPFGSQPPDRYGSTNFSKLPNVHSRVVEWWRKVKDDLITIWKNEVDSSPELRKLRDKYDELTRKTYTMTAEEWRKAVEERRKIWEEMEDLNNKLKKPIWERQFEAAKEFIEKVAGGHGHGKLRLELEPVSSVKLQGMRYVPKGKPSKKTLEKMHFYRWLDGKRDEIERLLSMFIPEGEEHTLRANIVKKLDRAFQQGGSIWLDGRGVDDFGVFLHEFAHWLEEVVDSNHNGIVKRFYDMRTRADTLLPLRGGGTYKPDKWRYPYQGRYYPNGATEVISMIFSALLDVSTAYDGIIEDDAQVVNFFITYLRRWYL